MASPSIITSSELQVGYNDVGVTSATISYTCPTATTNRLLVIWVSGNTGSSAVSATFNGTSMIAGTDFTESQVFGRYFYLVNPAVTTANVVVTFGSSTVRYNVVGATYQDVDPTTPLDGVTPVNGTGVSTSGSLAVTTNTNNGKIIFFLGVALGATSLVGASGGTLRVQATASGSDVGAWSDEEITTAGSGTTGMSWTGSVGFDANMIALKYNNTAVATSNSNFFALM